jgi:hypothetical protein
VMTISWFTNGMFYFTEECPSRRRSSLIADGKKCVRPPRYDPSLSSFEAPFGTEGKQGKKVGHPKRRGNGCRAEARRYISKRLRDGLRHEPTLRYDPS